VWGEGVRLSLGVGVNFQVKTAGFCAFLLQKNYLWPETGARGLN